MRLLLRIVAVLVILAVLVVVVGALLPRDHVASVSDRVPVPPDSLYKIVSSPAAFPRWRPSVRKTETVETGDTLVRWREYDSHGSVGFRARLNERPRRLVTAITDSGLPYGGTWEYAIAPDGPSGSTLTITEHGSVYNPVFRFVSRFIIGHTATIKAYLTDLDRLTSRR